MIPKQFLYLRNCFEDVKKIRDLVSDVKYGLADIYVEVDDDWVDILVFMGKEVEANLFNTVEEWIMHYPEQDYIYDAIISRSIQKYAISPLTDFDFIDLMVATREYFDALPINELRVINERKWSKQQS
ncbi:hypothetical protein [Rummeliibacillus sp. TYF-LIM-RU47]|uniref:hypothetical protein n=1 Tax=Rummeliibacillus sp. TYF-LIM-RU47 TaxID=2608406 RepID=UPI00123AF57B|nr:hypothetical protein [Rummeliibacillus sp. TYF-LIM-RU47]